MVEYFACDKCKEMDAESYGDAWIVEDCSNYRGKIRHVCRDCAIAHWMGQMKEWMK